MTITIEIKPGVQAELAAQAAALGVDIPTYAAIILEQAAQPAPLERKNRSLDEFEKSLDRITQLSHQIPLLPDEAFSRENLRADHDR